jgi:hypothetical protein
LQVFRLALAVFPFFFLFNLSGFEIHVFVTWTRHRTNRQEIQGHRWRQRQFFIIYAQCICCISCTRCVRLSRTGSEQVAGKKCGNREGDAANFPPLAFYGQRYPVLTFACSALPPTQLQPHTGMILLYCSRPRQNVMPLCLRRGVAVQSAMQIIFWWILNKSATMTAGPIRKWMRWQLQHQAIRIASSEMNWNCTLPVRALRLQQQGSNETPPCKCASSTRHSFCTHTRPFAGAPCQTRSFKGSRHMNVVKSSSDFLFQFVHTSKLLFLAFPTFCCNMI